MRKKTKEERKKVLAKANLGVRKLLPLGSLYAQEWLFQFIVRCRDFLYDP